MHEVEGPLVQNLNRIEGGILNRAPTKNKAGFWVLDAALLFLGMMVLLLVLKLLSFDDPNPLNNAWLYVLGVPTCLIATSMITRVLANDVIEKSIQLGFLLSVGLHLCFMFFAVNMVLFGSYWPTEMQKLAIVPAAQKVTTAQFFQPASANEARPDYLKPAKTEQHVAQEILDLTQKAIESAKLNVDVSKDEIKPTLADKQFIKPRKEASPSQPTISSTAEKLDRPDPNKSLDRQERSIDVPTLKSAQPTPSQVLSAAAMDVDRVAPPSLKNNALSAMPPAKLDIESRVNQGSEKGIRKSSKVRDEKSTNRELETALNRTASDLPDRPSPLQRSIRDTEQDKPLTADVPVPRLGAPLVQNDSDSPSERSTEMSSRSNSSKSSSTQSMDLAKLQSGVKLEPNLGRSLSFANQGANTKTDRSLALSDGSFLSDPRFALKDAGGVKRPERIPEGAVTAPAASQPVPTEGGRPTIVPDSTAIGELSEAMASRSEIGKSDTGKRATNQSATKGNDTLSLSPTVGVPAMELGRDAWAAPLLDMPRKGLDAAKLDVSLPNVRDPEPSVDRLRRPETGGPKIANSAVPIPTPAFSQRMKRNREQDDPAADMGPLGPQTEQAIENGLQFLAKYQRADGSWHLEDFDEPVDIRSDTAATALALLSFQGAGYTHRQFKYEGVCGRALAWMIKNQRANGDLYVRTDPKSDGNSWLYSHAIATLALCEAYGMTQDETIKKNAQSAINFLMQSQDPQGGGWRYTPKVGSDTSVTGWCMMALKSAELSGLEVTKESYRGIAKWLDGSQASESQKYLYRYNYQASDAPATRHGRVPTPVMTSVGLLMRLYLGWRRDNPDMQRGTDWLMDRPPAEGTAQNPQRDTYYWYYATQVMFHMGGNRWKAWYGNLYPMLIRTQKTQGDFTGSWEPNGRIPDAWGRFGGRLYVTTLNLLSLEVYYRHLPIYEATAD
jgi:hypothetical protein